MPAVVRSRRPPARRPAAAPAPRLAAAALFLAALALVLTCSAAFATAPPQDAPRLQPLPPADELADLVAVRLALVPGEDLQPWELAYRVEHGAEENPTPLR